jgi:hypothetical protein
MSSFWKQSASAVLVGWMALSGEWVRAADKAPVAATPATTEPAPEAASEEARLEFFEKKIRPLLAANCYNCHSTESGPKGGLRVDDHRGLLTGGNGGPAVVPGDLEKSRLLKAVKHEQGVPSMPPKKQLAAEEIAALEQWIKDGAVWPKAKVPASFGKESSDYARLRKEHWAWQPLTIPAAPTVAQPAWVQDPIDLFVLSQLDKQGLAPVADASRGDLIRRVTFDLTGLPPTVEETAAFEADTAADAFEKVVDRLLASPAFGERWGRHWLDVARYGESTGSARNLPYPHAWRYRDYVINSFNADKPYDQFVREQIAGDLLPFTSDAQRNEQLIATGFLALGVKDVNQRFKVRFVMDNIDEQIDTVTKSILAISVSCARCHDHKFDPISQSEYYGLAGIFHSTDHCAGLRNKMGGGGLDYYDTAMLIPLAGEAAAAPADLDEKIKAAEEKLEEARKAFVALRDSKEGDEKAPNGRPKRQVARQKMNRAQAELNALKDPAARGAVTLGVRDSKEIGDTEVRIRGEAEKLGPVVPRGFPKLVELEGTPTIPADQSGRLQLAQWMTDARNPLASRVIVNRVWQHLFGQGIVLTVDNFGVTGQPPTHPELLDHLAQRLIAENWSLKKLIRAVVLSHSYRLGTEATPTHIEKDPANRFVWRHTPRRLDAEELRDAMLTAAGRIKATAVEGSPAKALPVIEVRNNGPEAQKLLEAANASLNRSVYLPLLRGITPVSLEVFDFAEQDLVTGQRENTVVAPQSLYLLNDPFVRRQSLSAAQRVLGETLADDRARLSRLYQLILGRPANTAELGRAEQFLTDFAQQASESLTFATPEPKADAESAAKTEVAVADPAATGGAGTGTGTGGTGTATALPPNPDDVEQTELAPKADEVLPASPVEAAWASLAQALFGSAEFRHLK